MSQDLINSPEERAGVIGEIILAARQLEAALRKLSGPTEVAGLHALTELLGSRLPEEARQKLHYVATIRNRAAHEDDFMLSADEIMFVHIREPEEIKKFVDATGGAAKTMLVRGGKRMSNEKYGNASDDGVENYSYDFYFMNDSTLEDAETNFVALLSEIVG